MPDELAQQFLDLDLTDCVKEQLVDDLTDDFMDEIEKSPVQTVEDAIRSFFHFGTAGDKPEFPLDGNPACPG